MDLPCLSKFREKLGLFMLDEKGFSSPSISSCILPFLEKYEKLSRSEKIPQPLLDSLFSDTQERLRDVIVEWDFGFLVDEMCDGMVNRMKELPPRMAVGEIRETLHKLSKASMEIAEAGSEIKAELEQVSLLAEKASKAETRLEKLEVIEAFVAATHRRGGDAPLLNRACGSISPEVDDETLKFLDCLASKESKLI